MGTLTVLSKDPAYLPQVSSNSNGVECWSGLHVYQLTPELTQRLYEYARSEGYLQGWNDSVYERLGENRQSPFHPALLNGEPQRVWQQGYEVGRTEQSTPADYQRDDDEDYYRDE